MNNRRSILELSNDEAKAFCLRSTSYNQVPSLLPVIALFSNTDNRAINRF